MNFWKPMVFLVVLMGCNTPSIDLSEAVMLEQQGNDIGALDLYLKVIEENPNSMHAQNALPSVQRIHLRTAKAMEAKDSARAEILYKRIIAQWPNSKYAVVSQRRLDNLGAPSGEKEISAAIDAATEPVTDVIEDSKNTEVKSNAIVDEAELAACDAARSSESRIVWQQYKQNFPSGACVEEAEAFLKVVEPRALELEQAKQKAAGALTGLKSLCAEYRLAQTTSDDNACNNPGRALSNELARLQRRKADLLKDGDSEKEAYYQKFIPPRWDKLSQGKSTACTDVVQYVSDLERQGVNRDAVESALVNVQVCFSNPTL